MISKVKTRNFGISRCTYQELLEEMDVWRQDGGRHFACFCDANGLAFSATDMELCSAYRHADVVCADGSATLILAAIYGGFLPGRIIGPYLFPKALEFGLSRGWRHFFYGAGPGTAELLAGKMKEAFPGLQVVGWISPPYGEVSEQQQKVLFDRIEAEKPDILWVALGSPKQEKWCFANQERLNVPIMMPVGAVFDFYSGKVPHAPDWVHPLGARWLWRLLTGGKRTFLRNIWCVPKAANILVKEFLLVRIMKRYMEENNEHLV